MPQHAESEEGQRNGLRKEHPADAWVDVGEGIANASDDEVLKRPCLPHKGALFPRRKKETVTYEGDWQLNSYM